MIRMIMITLLIITHFFVTPSYASQPEQNEEQPRSSLKVTDMAFEDDYAEEENSDDEDGSPNQDQLPNQEHSQEKEQTRLPMHDIPEESEEGEDDDDRADTTYENLDYYPNPLFDQNYQVNNLPHINNDINPAQIIHGLPPLVMSIHVNGHKINLRDMQP